MTFDQFVMQARTKILVRRQDHSNVGEARVTPDTAWWQEVARHLWTEIEILKASLANLESELGATDPSTGTLSPPVEKRGPGRPPKAIN